MTKRFEQWLLFKYVGGEFTPLSKPFRTKQQAEKARSKYPEWEAQDSRRGRNTAFRKTDDILAHSEVQMIVTGKARGNSGLHSVVTRLGFG